MKYILGFLLMILSLTSVGFSKNQSTGQVDKKECECQTCLAKGNCVFRNDEGRLVVEKAAKPRASRQKSGKSNAKGM